MSRAGAGRKSMSLAFTISDLRRRPEFFDTVAMRIWRAWWEPNGTPLDHITGLLRENMNTTPIPFAPVAHDGEAFLGTTSVIASDLAERPHLTPWVAAVWVEPAARERGVGGALGNGPRKIASRSASAAPIYVRDGRVQLFTKGWAGSRSSGMSARTS